MAATAEAASGFSEKTHFLVPEPPSKIRKIPSKSHSNSLCKTLIIVLLLLVIPLFPSEAPDFISQSIFTEFWEIIHLLFIGIAVSYGLFSRRTDGMVLNSRNNDDSQAYLSGISHLSSIFEDGLENLSGLDDEQYMMKTRSFVHGTENICEVNSENVKQTWCSQYVKGESLVVVSNGKYFLGGSSDSKPLNLPVRSLRSRIVDNDKPEVDDRHKFSPKIEDKNNDVRNLRSRTVDNDRPEFDDRHRFSPKIEDKNNDVRNLRSRTVDNDRPEFKNGLEFSPKIEEKIHKNSDDVKVVKIRGVRATNLEKKFEEASGFSPLPWRSRSGRMQKGEEMSNLKPPLHSRPHSVGEFEFENLKSRTFFGSKFCSSPELASSKVENSESTRLFSVSRPKIAPLDAETSISGPFEYDLKKSFNHGDEDIARKGKRAIESLNSDTKSSSLAKVISRAKSVRTIKPRLYLMDSKSEANLLAKRESGEESENPPLNHQNQELDSIFPKPKPKPNLIDFNGGAKEDIDDQNVTVSEEDNESGLYNSSDEEDDVRTNVENDAELEGSEVDRKAGEFIAKFREQIRLQKISYAEGYSGNLQQLDKL
ncbi:hypothetical protein CDL12_06619 [Handroanthus impetiginosus]|uniref:Uncharacterized protein n=1 Tax=Handroanthus impetiginosus TaxID=429701 RepID=A0A2G9HT97_9LAMI|nr:hypothetical protein CDL12_06619 [Handroanthus impetiginosus]